LKVTPTEVVTDAAPVYPRVLDDLVPTAWHRVERYAKNRIEADHGRLKHRLNRCEGCVPTGPRPSSIAGFALVQNLCRGHYHLAAELPRALRSPRRW
jgi:transposase-like protein